MAGLLNSQQSPQKNVQTGSESIDDPVLKQIENGIEQSVPPELKRQYMAIVVAGMNVMFSKETSQLMDQQLSSSDDIVQSVSDGIAKLIVIVFNESKQGVEEFAPAAGLASVTLMCQALEYASESKGVDITPEMAAECAKQTMMKTMEKFGITQDQVGQVLSAGQQQGGTAPDNGMAAQQPMGA